MKTTATAFLKRSEFSVSSNPKAIHTELSR
jgi:hypothetical protein